MKCSILTMVTKTVTIPKTEYTRLKRESKTTHELLLSLVRGLEDIKNGRYVIWKK